jgi:hypothetical protein
LHPAGGRSNDKEESMKQLKRKHIPFTLVVRSPQPGVGCLTLTPREARPELFGACQVRRGLHDCAG